MAITSQKISNHPDFKNIERTADVIEFSVNGLSKRCLIRVIIRYTDGDTDMSNRFPQGVLEIVADNSKAVTVRDENFNPILDKDGNEQEMPAYDYVAMLLDNPIATTKMLQFFVQLNDGYKFFNVQ